MTLSFLKWDELKSNPALVWVVLFVIMGFIVRGVGGTNASSRYATLQAMADEQSFAIDNYLSWSEDWSPSPNGRKYSNKAPGPMLLGFPLFFVLDRFSKKVGEREFRENGLVVQIFGPTFQGVFSLIMQVLPFALFTLYLGARWKQDSLKWRIFILSYLFGNTAILFMNSYFGHGMAALCFAITIFCLLEKKYFYTGLFYGFTLLTDYGAVISLPLILLFIGHSEFKNLKKTIPFFYGGVFPGILWCTYHWSAFGSPFLTSISFPNPMFIFHEEGAALGGMFKLFPSWKVFFELLFGKTRGILFTQPWLIFLSAWTIFNFKKVNLLFSLLIVNLLVLVWMNATFWGWHAGSTAGPRYLSYLFLAACFVLYFQYDKFPPLFKKIMWISVAISLIFRAQVYATTILAPIEPLWSWQWRTILEHETVQSFFRMIVFYFLLVIAWFAANYQRDHFTK